MVIFVGGPGRTGTTLMMAMLNAHSEVTMYPEVHPFGSKPLDVNNKQFVARMQRAGVEMPENLPAETFCERCEVVKHILRHARTPHSGIKIMNDIRNHRQLSKVFDAKYICMYRDPRDMYASQKKCGGMAGSSVEAAMNSYKKTIEACIGELDILMVKYEFLVAQTSSAMETVLAFLGLEWEDSVLCHTAYPNALTKDHSVSHYSREQIMRPVNGDSIGKWQTELSVEEAAIIESMTDDIYLF